MQLEQALESFHRFADGFQPDAPGPTPLDVKREHTLLVLENARLILAGLPVPPRLAHLGLLAALFHDIGRFPQYQQYGTFRDPDSVNHGLMGSRTLAPQPRGAGLLDSLPFRERSLVRGVVALHNRRFLPRKLPPVLRFLTRVVRDADKLDVMRVMVEHFDTKNENPVLTLRVKTDPEIFSRAVYDDVMTGGRGDYRKLRWSNDFKLMLIGWVHDFNFASSRRLLLERGLFDRMLEQLPTSYPFEQLKRQVLRLLAEDLQRKDQEAPLPEEAAAEFRD